MLVKKGLLSFAMALPLVSTMAFAGHSASSSSLGGGSSIDELRNRCYDMRANSQINPFTIKLLCSGSFTRWETEGKGYQLEAFGHVTAQTSCKGGRFETAQGTFPLPGSPFGSTCNVYHQVKTIAPAGIEVGIDRCDQLTVENVERLCHEAVASYCNAPGLPVDGALAGTSTTSSIKGMEQQQQPVCEEVVVGTLDTCANFF